MTVSVATSAAVSLTASFNFLVICRQEQPAQAVWSSFSSGFFIAVFFFSLFLVIEYYL
jgi:hypothetical protein